jgi:hypothetical protein
MECRVDVGRIQTLGSRPELTPDTSVELMRMLAVAKCRPMAILRSEFWPDCLVRSGFFSLGHFRRQLLRECCHRFFARGGVAVGWHRGGGGFEG